MRHPRLIHHGAVSGVTGSCHQPLMDEGRDLPIRFRGAEASPRDIRAEQLAIDSFLHELHIAPRLHFDHVWRISYLFAAGFKTPILCLEPSAKLLLIVLAHVFQVGSSYDQKRAQRSLTLIEQRIGALPYKQRFTLVDKAEIKALENTYDCRPHRRRRIHRRRLESALKPTLSNQRMALIPAFSSDRTRELLYTREGIIRHRDVETDKQLIPSVKSSLPLDATNLPVIPDFSLASRFTQINCEFNPLWDVKAKAPLKEKCSTMAFRNLLTVDSHQGCPVTVNSMGLTAMPVVVIGGNDMCSCRRIVNDLKATRGDREHDFLSLATGLKVRPKPATAIRSV